MNGRANRAVNYLRGLGVAKGDRVAILAPLNWRLTVRELVYIAADRQAKAIIGGPECATTIRASGHVALQTLYFVRVVNVTDPEFRFVELGRLGRFQEAECLCS